MTGWEMVDEGQEMAGWERVDEGQEMAGWEGVDQVQEMAGWERVDQGQETAGWEGGQEMAWSMLLSDKIMQVSSFQSWCGGLPAPECANNPLKYKFRLAVVLYQTDTYTE